MSAGDHLPGVDYAAIDAVLARSKAAIAQRQEARRQRSAAETRSDDL